MKLIVDEDNWRKSLEEIEEPAVSPLAVPACILVALRKHTEAVDLLPLLAVRLIRGVDQFDRSRGGSGVTYDPNGSTETATELTMRLYPNLDPIGDPFGRIDRIHAMLSRLAAEARTEVVATQQSDLRARIAAELESPIPRSVAARLVITPTPS